MGSRPLRFGVNVHNFGAAAEPAALLRWATTAEELGFHGVFISDHVAITPSVGKAYPEPFQDPFATLAWLAGQTAGINLGTSVVVLPHRHPILTARLVANIDHLSGGRFILGAGAGWSQDEFDALGLTFRERGRMSDEYLHAMVALWTSDVPVHFNGTHARFRDVAPVTCLQRPHATLWIGGSSEEALRRTLRFNAAWHPIIDSVDSFESLVGRLRALSEAENAPMPALCPRMELDLRPQAVDGERRLGLGSIEQLRDDLANLQRIGTEYVVLDPAPAFRMTTLDSLQTDLASHHRRGLEMLAAVADSVVDLAAHALR